MSERRGPLFDTRTIIGIGIIFIGGIILLDNIGMEIGVNLWDFWPAVLIFIGLGQILQKREQGSSLSGWLLFALGVLFLLNNFYIIDFGFAELWPIILIIIGIGILRHSFWARDRTPSDSDYINLSFILGGGEHNFSTSQLKGGKITAIMGGGSVDLTQADILEDELKIDVFAFWGGIDLRIPENWNVNIQASSILGGIDNKSTARFVDADADRKTLVITGAAIMGGVDIKN